MRQGVSSFHKDYVSALAARDALTMIGASVRFHMSIAQAGGNPYFTGLFGRLLDEGRRILNPYYKPYGEQFPERLVGEHAQMIAAIEARDVELADGLAKAHAQQMVEQIQTLFRANEITRMAL